MADKSLPELYAELLSLEPTDGPAYEALANAIRAQTRNRAPVEEPPAALIRKLCLQLDNPEEPQKRVFDMIDAIGPAFTPGTQKVLDAIEEESVIKKAAEALGERSAEWHFAKCLKVSASYRVDPADLAEYGRTLDEIHTHGRALDRDEVLDHLEEILVRPGSRSFVLVGEPGSGKSAVIHELGRRLRARTPRWHILETSTAEIMVGTKYIGEWETKLRGLIGKVLAPKRVLLYISNVNDIPGAGTTSSNKSNFAEMMAPYIRRGDITVIGESTPTALQNGLDKDGVLRRLFHHVTLEPPVDAAVPKLLRHRIGELATRAGVDIVVPQDALDTVIDLSGTYYSGMAQPGRSVMLLEQVLEHRLERRDLPKDVIEISTDDVIAGLARSTGLPDRLLNDRKPLDPTEVRGFFEERVLGQREATDAVVNLITLIKAGLTDPGKPLGVLFFVGPTGVGKTEIAKTLADYIFGSEERMIRIDLSEYKDYESFEKLIGGTYRNTEGGMLTNKVRQQPFSVILLDEFEKAHPNVFDLFLQVFDDGRLTDGKGQTTDFRHTIIIMTSNLGSGIGASGGGIGFGGGDDDVPGQEKVLREVRKFFRPEFVNRLDKIVVFKPLTTDVMRKIVRRELGKVVLRSGILRRALLVDIDPGVVDYLMREGFSQAFGARPLKRRVAELVLLPLAREIVGLKPEDRGSMLKARVEGDRLAVRHVRTREARAEERAIERLKLRGEGDRSVKPSELPQVLERLRARHARLAQQAEAGRYRERKSEIMDTTSAVTFWDEPSRARRLLGELSYLEDLLEILAGVTAQLEDLEDLGRVYTRHGASMKGRFETAYESFLERLAHAELRFLGERPEDRHDVFLSLLRIGADRDAAEAVDTMRKMYGAWADKRGFSVTPLFERADELGPVELTYAVEGISLYGQLRGEEGLHRFEQGGKGADRRATFARVEVLPRPDGDRRISRRDVKVERAGDTLILLHLPSGTTVDGAGDEDTLLDLLEARLGARLAAEATTLDPDRVVRRYNVEGKFVRDEQTGVKLVLKDLVAGALDEIVRARLLGGAEGSGGA
jgi:ATP-dependent Clp protease ATP-binding subunit ClpC